MPSGPSKLRIRCIMPILAAAVAHCTSDAPNTLPPMNTAAIGGAAASAGSSASGIGGADIGGVAGTAAAAAGTELAAVGGMRGSAGRTATPPAGAGDSGIGATAGSSNAPAAGGGAIVPTKPTLPSPGCGSAATPPNGSLSIDVDGTPRDYIVKVPTGYDPKRPYRLIFAWHGLGGTAMQIASSFGGGYYGLAARSASSAIFIAGQGLETSTGAAGASAAGSSAGWSNSGGRDVAFVRKLLDWARSKYCVDQNRIFSVGMSYGGIMSNTLGCELGDQFRAIAPMSGSGPRTFGGKTCVGQVAAWMSHGNIDTTVAFSAGQASRDHWLKANHCGTETQPIMPGTCLAYQGCDPGFPVTFCEFDGGHTIPPFASEAIWNFLAQF